MKTSYRTMDEIRIHTVPKVSDDPMFERIVTQFGDGFTTVDGRGGWCEDVTAYPQNVLTERSSVTTIMSADRGNLVNIAKLVAGFALYDHDESEVWVRTSWSDDVMVFSK